MTTSHTWAEVQLRSVGGFVRSKSREHQHHHAGLRHQRSRDIAGGFATALQILSEEHQAEVASLRSEVARLEATLQAASAGGAAGHPRRKTTRFMDDDTCPAPFEPSRSDSAVSVGPRALPRAPPVAPLAPDARGGVGDTDSESDYGDGAGDDGGDGDVEGLGGGGERGEREGEVVPDRPDEEDRPVHTASKPGLRTSPTRRTGSKISSFLDESEHQESMDEETMKESTLDIIKEMNAEMAKHPMNAYATEVRESERRILWIESFFGFAIVANTMSLGVSCDLAPQWIGWLAIDGLFAFIFTAEVLIKLCIHGLRKYFCGPDRFFNLFEVSLAALAILEIVLAVISLQADISSGQVLSLFRIVRLFRVFRVFRLIRLEVFNELKVMIRGTIGGMRTLMWSCVLIFLPVYSMSLVLRETLDYNSPDGELMEAEYFGTVPLAFFSVFRCIVIGECADKSGRPLFVLVTQSNGWPYALLYCSMAVFMSFGLFNVIVAMFVENVVRAAKAKQVAQRRERLRDKMYFAKKISELLVVILDYHDFKSSKDDFGHTNSTGKNPQIQDIFELAAELEIDRSAFERMRMDPRAQKILDELDIADEDEDNLFSTLDCDNSGCIDIEELCAGIAKLRGDTCRSDIVSINFLVQEVRSEVRGYMTHLMRRMQQHEDVLVAGFGLCRDDLEASGRKASRESMGKSRSSIIARTPRSA